MNKYNKVHIFLRDTTHNRYQALRPNWHNYEKCFTNLIKTTDWNHAELTVILDGKYEESHLSKYLPKHKVIEIDTKTRTTQIFDGSNASQAMTVEIMGNTKISDDTILFLTENDYTRRPGWSLVAIDFFNCVDDNYYCGLYDHADKYINVNPNSNTDTGMYKDLKSKIFLTNYCHWREVPNITSCYLITPTNFKRDYDLFVEGGPDAGTCEKLSWRGRKFATPIPSWSTHNQNPWLAPGFDWEKIQNV